jgi:hypothetical protein
MHIYFLELRTFVLPLQDDGKGILGRPERHLEGSYVGGQSIKQLFLARFGFSGMEYTGRMDFRTTCMETCLLRSDFYFDHNFFI